MIGSISIAVLNFTTGIATCRKSGIKYDNDYWPRDFLSSYCTYQGITKLKNILNQTLNNGLQCHTYYCKMPSFTMHAYINIENHNNIENLIRIEIDENLPIWARQIWDTTILRETEFIEGYWEEPKWWSECPIE
jgi:hypothetical protein